MFDRSECEDRPYECCLVTPFPNKLLSIQSTVEYCLAKHLCVVFSRSSSSSPLAAYLFMRFIYSKWFVEPCNGLSKSKQNYHHLLLSSTATFFIFIISKQTHKPTWSACVCVCVCALARTQHCDILSSIWRRLFPCVYDFIQNKQLTKVNKSRTKNRI